MPTINLDREVADWAQLLTPEYRYIFIKGGRGSGKSHEVAGYLVEESTCNPDDKTVCIREVQKSIKFSSKLLIDDKISKYGLSEYYDSIQTEIRNKNGTGLYAFIGMSDQTADSVKSLEGFKRSWFEEAQNCSAKSLKLLRPTIRMQGSQLIFTWNPDQPDDPIEKFCNDMKDDPSCLIIHVNYDRNPFMPETLYQEMLLDKERYPDDFDHIWLGGYNLRSDIRVFSKWRVEECEPTFDDDVYFGSDFGFAKDPTTLLRTWKDDFKKEIYVDYQIDGVGIETDALPEFFEQIPESKKWKITADSARPETISYLSRRGFNIVGAEKGKGSVEDGVEWLRGWTIVVHPRCKLLQKELRLYSYQVDKVGNILPKVDDKASLDHTIDALRYAWESFIKNDTGGGFYSI